MKLEELINEYYDRLNENDMHVLKYVLNNKERSGHMGINELAEVCHASRSSVHRLTKKLGFSGYSEFRVFLKWEETQGKAEPGHIQRLESDTAATIKHLATVDFNPIIQQLADAKRIFIYASGTAQLSCAKEAQRLFAIVHTFVTVIHDSVEFETIFPAIDAEDVVIILSLSGDTPALLPQAKQLNARGIPFISITNLKNNHLAQMSPYALYAASTPAQSKQGAEIVSFVPFYIAVETLFRHYTEKIEQDL
ncbi:MurR/RpiR family transcriptional regulator [Salisediminibacterium halotolerans]|uniref:RpiR family transcriptional regulator, glv operon transcriptional regulator n=1 Tax=Salisediminibacterium halotolerans TaxID=517425 RepID=A0A1H9UAS0_9BACI|nr:MurR/RpiR family transcriptional regulator [Salisediminibacterium haloalkalitolerans]SES06546.1 RpiR family transcriptional regulator, glv operon transcriptional regulator [Salisediminibacterium haloalkalitolerans]